MSKLCHILGAVLKHKEKGEGGSSIDSILILALKYTYFQLPPEDLRICRGKNLFYYP